MKKILIILILASFIGCTKDSLPESIKTPDGLVQWNILKVEGPSTTNINQTIAIEVTYPTSSGCDFVSEFRTETYQNYIYVKAFGGTLKDSPCTLSATPKQINFNYTPIVAGDIIFKFFNRDNSSIEHKIRVQ